MSAYKYGREGNIIRVSDGASFPQFPGNRDYDEYAIYVHSGGVTDPADVTPTPTQFELDQNRYQKRAAVQALLLSYMAADNMSRVRTGTWTVQQLTSLLADPAVQAAQTYMSTLSYELAAQSIAAATSPLLTPEIKADWVAKLTEHFYLVP